jgi:hypothetical protein
MLLRHMAEHVRESDAGAAEQFDRRAGEAERRSAQVRTAVFSHDKLSVEKVVEGGEAPAAAT